MKSKNIYLNRYVYTLTTTATTFIVLKGKRGGWHRVTRVTLANISAVQTVSGWIGLVKNGITHIFDVTGTIAALGTKSWVDSFFLNDGVDLYLLISCNANTATVQVNVQSVFYPD